MSYDYFEAVKDDVRDYIDCNINLEDYEDKYELEDYLNRILWTEDSVTGNGSGSYTFSRAKAKEYIFGADVCEIEDMAITFEIDSKILVGSFFNEDWEYFDVSMRCYYLDTAIYDVLNELYEEIEN